MKVAEPKRDKTELFNEALKDAQSEPRTEAVTARKTKPAKEAEAAPAPAEEAAAAGITTETPIEDVAAKVAVDQGPDDAALEEAPQAETPSKAPEETTVGEDTSATNTEG
jgi:small subunit ribosomal protein S16